MTPLDHDPDEGCDGCPFYAEDYNDTRVFRECALHPGLDDEGASRAPGWCPLRAGPVLVVPPGWTAPEQQTGGACRISIERVKARRYHIVRGYDPTYGAIYKLFAEADPAWPEARDRYAHVRSLVARTDAEAQAAFARFVETGRCW